MQRRRFMGSCSGAFLYSALATPAPGALPPESIDEILLMMAWFRAHPDALRRTTPYAHWLR